MKSSQIALGNGLLAAVELCLLPVIVLEVEHDL